MGVVFSWQSRSVDRAAKYTKCCAGTFGQGESHPASEAFALRTCIGAGRGGRTPTRLPSADFESAASASSAIPAHPNSNSVDRDYHRQTDQCHTDLFLHRISLNAHGNASMFSPSQTPLMGFTPATKSPCLTQRRTRPMRLAPAASPRIRQPGHHARYKVP
jgi:hypothetical protein